MKQTKELQENPEGFSGHRKSADFLYDDLTYAQFKRDAERKESMEKEE